MGTDKRIALFAGSFDPFTIGHQSIVDRGLELFDGIVIGIGANASKNASSSPAERLATISALYTSEPRVEVRLIEGLTAEAARNLGAKFLLRGVRSAADFEYERNLADINRAIASVESVLLYALPELAMVSSSMVRELQSYGADISSFIPKI